MCDCEVKSMNLGGGPSAEGLLLHGGRGTCPHEACDLKRSLAYTPWIFLAEVNSSTKVALVFRLWLDCKVNYIKP